MFIVFKFGRVFYYVSSMNEVYSSNETPNVMTVGVEKYGLKDSRIWFSPTLLPAPQFWKLENRIAWCIILNKTEFWIDFVPEFSWHKSNEAWKTAAMVS
jgi:hypothetical protein